MGKPVFLEEARNRLALPCRYSDVFSFGVIVWELVTLEEPWKREVADRIRDFAIWAKVRRARQTNGDGAASERQPCCMAFAITRAGARSIHVTEMHSTPAIKTPSPFLA